MDGHRFDDLTRALARAANRRDIVRTAIGGVLGAGAALLGVKPTTDAAQRPEIPPRGRYPLQLCGPNRPPCPARTACINRRCVSCGPALTACGNTCVDALTDRNNCGDCGIVCGPDEVCGLGFCGIPCTDNFDCPDDLTRPCTLGVCFGGGCNIVAAECLFDQPKQDCCKTADGIFCVNFRNSRRHCGRCYNDCGDAGCCDGVCCT